jgi:hypothetical protein
LPLFEPTSDYAALEKFVYYGPEDPTSLTKKNRAVMHAVVQHILSSAAPGRLHTVHLNDAPYQVLAAVSTWYQVRVSDSDMLPCCVDALGFARSVRIPSAYHFLDHFVDMSMRDDRLDPERRLTTGVRWRKFGTTLGYELRLDAWGELCVYLGRHAPDLTEASIALAAVLRSETIESMLAYLQRVRTLRHVHIERLTTSQALPALRTLARHPELERVTFGRVDGRHQGSPKRVRQFFKEHCRTYDTSYPVVLAPNF